MSQILGQSELIEYWKKVKETIHLFDGIIVRYVVQWSNVLLVMVGASVVVFSQAQTYSMIAGGIALAACIIAFPIAIKCYFYYELLEEALKVGLEIEKLIFQDNNRANQLGLTHRLTNISTRKTYGMTFFGWSIFLPFAFLAFLSLTLALVFFGAITTLLEFLLWITIAPTITLIALGFIRRGK
ncbi:MAG: hypothetical protein OEY22_11040 [Candidatus Bathyarchaeota archaeon]|nr:hypothetical protein [Candidatus Bathyarchaeota archaeon]MDH5786666.1 hypothetical protein [Candidatus Bathyarchaeota archaeon]